MTILCIIKTGENMDYYNQRINCNVHICKYFDKQEEKCTLGAITIDQENKQTICKNFEKRN